MENPVPPEIESTLSRLSAYRSVRGVMILSRDPSGIVQSSGTVFEGDSGRRYAGAVESVVAATAAAVGNVEEGDELRLMRIRTKRHELIITPGKEAKGRS
ncbi:hypothetical protein CcaverHIS002_0205250 [Cutaneotrichosporon cavernicola]|uniref:Roadblock/LAMTOR2 domain-containing protein n=1 Tax=Cutaneotrichosporon cavernicola TaxID=279322 RepID=A0AA48I3W8_9TREE|nr:uncharacterized protein CcaverHIS019_0205210 [Cutaneotrichosporon cavernicola]BEI81365.1 hypothetical protein CcaverHIS002_0205250 [Cutaneotrichosporon cavernicola]BEI89159.1 hypothetical protein CcaverHIS019_0205210 [Cutaneotrichosporon cavernicola]BEI96936.1 hypothetical protein CcaverHIS631_0205250 [Cutaneotrichosporon cavernicola]BEJ04708.1 hypothetical protein CcaverHIS641_0205250 [Cutaneotrichosporon cavernicola]